MADFTLGLVRMGNSCSHALDEFTHDVCDFWMTSLQEVEEHFKKAGECARISRS